MKKSHTDLTIGTLMGLLVLLFVVILMLFRGQKESLNTKFDKRFLSMDLSMFIDTIYSSPNDLIVKYPQKTYDYSYRFEKSRITVYKNKEGIKLGESFPFTEQKDIEFIYTTVDINYAQDNNEITVGGDEGSDNIPLVFEKTKHALLPTSKIKTEEFFD
ncbi:hypothetical protein GF327_06870 [Candidatus Woesearchaeota archaeon]|nr:hypothetical protein [Candidatus Woesearchaeota archaeon]